MIMTAETSYWHKQTSSHAYGMDLAALLDLLSFQAYMHRDSAEGLPVYLYTALHLPCCASALHCPMLISVMPSLQMRT